MKSLLIALVSIVSFIPSNGEGIRSGGGLNLGQYVSTNGSTTITKTYYLSNSFLNIWVTDYNFCKSNGMDLVILDSAAEAEVFLGLCDKNKDKFKMDIPMALIGGVLNLEDNEFRWFETGEKIGFDLTWAPNEPTEFAKEYCLSVVPGKGFADDWCTSIKLFICQEVKSKSAGMTTKAPVNAFTKKKF